MHFLTDSGCALDGTGKTIIYRMEMMWFDPVMLAPQASALSAEFDAVPITS